MEEYKLDDAYKEFSKQYSRRFGKIAVDKRFITAKQLNEAFVEQIEDDFSNNPHRFMGNILFEHGWITIEQVDIILGISL
jgi:hypothetical protein